MIRFFYATQVQVPDGSKYVQTDDKRTKGASCVQNYVEWKHQKTHEILRMNARKSDERTKVWTWTHESLNMNARKSEHERAKVWWTHETFDLNALQSEHKRTEIWRTHISLEMNVRKSGERTKILT